MNDRFQPDKVDFSRERLDFRPKRADFRPERDDIRPRRPDFRPERADFSLAEADFRSEGLDGKVGARGRTNKRTDRRTNKQKSPCDLQDLVPFGPLPKNLKSRLMRNSLYS